MLMRENTIKVAKLNEEFINTIKCFAHNELKGGTNKVIIFNKSLNLSNDTYYDNSAVDSLEITANGNVVASNEGETTYELYSLNAEINAAIADILLNGEYYIETI